MSAINTIRRNVDYGFNNPLQEIQPLPILARRAPTAADIRYPIGQQWIDQVGLTQYYLLRVAAGAATWQVNAIGVNVALAGFLTAGTSIASGTTITAGTSMTVTTSLLVGTTITATAGDITATLGNLILNGAAKQIRIHGGAATDFIGETTLVGGVATVLNTNIAATDRIFLSRRDVNGSVAIGNLTYVITPATSFVITSVQAAAPAVTEANDVSILEYIIVRQV